MQVLNPDVVKGKWTSGEDDILRTNVPLNTHKVAGSGAKKKTSWAKVAKLLSGRNGKQTRERWMNHVGPNVKKGAFSAKEDQEVQRLHAKHRGKWVLMAGDMKGRTANAIKNRYNAGLRKKARLGKRAGSKGSKGRPEKKKVSNAPAYGVMIVSSVAKLSGGVPQCPKAELAKVAGDGDLADLYLVQNKGATGAPPSFSIDAIVDECFRMWPSLASSDVYTGTSLDFKSGPATRVVPLRAMLATEARKLGRRGLFNVASDKYKTDLAFAPWPTWIAKMTHFQLAQIRDEAVKVLKSRTAVGAMHLDRSLMSEVLTVYTSDQGHKGPKSNGTLTVRPSFRTPMTDAESTVGLGLKRKAAAASSSAAGGAASSRGSARKKPRGDSSTQVQL